MKIAILVNELNVLGGTHKQVLRIAEFLEKQGHQLVIVTRYFDIEKTYHAFNRFNIEYLYKDYNFTSHGIIAKIKNNVKSIRDAFLLAKISKSSFKSFPAERKSYLVLSGTFLTLWFII